MPSTLRPRLLAGFGCLLALIGVLGVLALQVMGDLSDRAQHVSQDNIPELTLTDDARFALQEYRQLQLRHLLAPSTAEKAAREAELMDLGGEVTSRLKERISVVPDGAERTERVRLFGLWQRYVALSNPSLAQSRVGDERRAVGTLIGPAEKTFRELQRGLQESLAFEQAEAADISATGRASYRAAREIFVLSVLIVVLGAAGIGLWFLVVAPMRRSGAVEGYRRRFHQGLEMADTEDEALEVTGRALGQACPKVPVELLLADSSQAHLYQAVTSGPDPAGPGCAVSSPRGCAAVRRGQATVFDSSEAVGACPRLRDRPGGPCSAVCTPVTVLGRTIGVLHATGPVGRPPAEQTRDTLEATGAQIGSRLGVIRAMSQSQLQASTDPLTGLLNRRSLEDRVQDMRREGTPFAVAMADLDHFKALNDSFGHETGDRALRLFSRTLAETARVEDVVARYGGEEFVVVFPRCSAREAAEVLERVRANLRTALAGGEVPEFTCSAGVAEAAPEELFQDALRAADEALLGAKRSGRDRVLIASSIRA